MIGNNYQFSISGKARENMETVKRSSNNVIEFLQSEGYIRFKADSEASSKAIYEAYTRCNLNWGITSARYSVPSQRITVLSLPGWQSWKQERIRKCTLPIRIHPVRKGQ